MYKLPAASLVTPRGLPRKAAVAGRLFGPPPATVVMVSCASASGARRRTDRNVVAARHMVLLDAERFRTQDRWTIGNEHASEREIVVELQSATYILASTPSRIFWVLSRAL
jgi:hypothetical protein